MSQSSGVSTLQGKTLIKQRRHARLHEVEAGFLIVEFAGAESRKPRKLGCVIGMYAVVRGVSSEHRTHMTYRTYRSYSYRNPSQPCDSSNHPKHSSSVERPRQTSRQHRPSHSSKPQKTGCFRTLLIHAGVVELDAACSCCQLERLYNRSHPRSHEQNNVHLAAYPGDCCSRIDLSCFGKVSTTSSSTASQPLRRHKLSNRSTDYP